MVLGLSESQDAILLHILFSDYYLIYLSFDKPIFPKYQDIRLVFYPLYVIEDAVRSCPLIGHKATIRR